MGTGNDGRFFFLECERTRLLGEVAQLKGMLDRRSALVVALRAQVDGLLRMLADAEPRVGRANP